MKKLIQISLRYPKNIRAAFLLGLHSEIGTQNPYINGNDTQVGSNRKTWNIAFRRAFEHGQYLKKKHNYLIQQKLF